MRKAWLFVLLAGIINTLQAQRVAHYYFENSLDEFTGNFIPLEVTGEQGSFNMEVVPKFGQKPRKVYVFPPDAGLLFNNPELKDFITDSYAIEMYFRYDNGELLLYGQLLGDQLEQKQGDFVHLVMTRDAVTGRVLVYLEGELEMEFVDSQNQMAMDGDSQILFFKQDGVVTTSGAVAMIKVYNYFIDKEEGKELFETFQVNTLEENLDLSSEANTQLNRLFFIQSQAKLLPESYPMLEQLTKQLKENADLTIEIQGHTDNQGDYKLNIELSKDRAEAIKTYLEEEGIDSKRLKTRGFGGSRPIASNASESTRKLNRRVEIKVL